MDKEAQEKIANEDISKVLVTDLPRQEEYSQIIYDAQNTGKYSQSDFAKSQEANQKAWSGIKDLMAQCIARGMRLGYRKPLDRPELEKEIDALLTRLGERYDGASHPKLLVKVHRDEILALYIPKDKPPVDVPDCELTGDTDDYGY